MPKIVPKDQHKGSISKYRPPQMNEAEWFDLFDIVHRTIFKRNWSATARALDVSINTAKGWEDKPPKRGWELHNLHRVVREMVPFLLLSKHKKVRKQATEVRILLRKRGLEKLADAIDAQTVNHSDAQRYLLSEIAWEGTREISTATLFTAARSGGYSKKTLREAATQLGLTIIQVGKGEARTAWYRIPHPDDLGDTE